MADIHRECPGCNNVYADVDYIQISIGSRGHGLECPNCRHSGKHNIFQITDKPAIHVASEQEVANALEIVSLLKDMRLNKCRLQAGVVADWEVATVTGDYTVGLEKTIFEALRDAKDKNWGKSCQ